MVKIAKPHFTREAAVEGGVVKAVRCRAEVDEGFKITFIGVPREEANARVEELEERPQAEELRVEPAMEEGAAGGGSKTAELEAAADYGAYLEELRREFGRLSVYIGVEDGHIYVKLMGRVDSKQFRRYVKTCKRLGFRFEGGRWVKRLS